MSEQLQLVSSAPGLPPVPWRDPQTVSRADLATYIEKLELACQENPDSADLHTCLGMARAMNFEAYKSIDALEKAIAIDPNNFWAQLKYAELHYRLRALPKAEKEMLLALELAGSYLEASVAKKHLLEIRRLIREGSQKPAWTKPLLAPTAALGLILLLSCLITLSR